MCGIIGYVGTQDAEPILVEGLRRLEYRGYDSAGLATLERGHLHLRKKAGRIDALAGLLRERPAPGYVGISHTRWATHGPANDVNAHPHLSADGRVAVVHNGVIENYAALKRQLQSEGVPFRSDTDTEVIAQLIARHLDEGGLLAAVRGRAAAAQGHLRPGRPQSDRARRRSSAPASAARSCSASASTSTSLPATPPPWSATPRRSFT